MFKPLFAPNGSPMLRPSDFVPGGYFHKPKASLAISPESFLRKETEQAADYAPPVVGSTPNGLGFTFGDSWARTQRGTMEFNLPTGQISTINMSLRYAAENVFVGKAMRMKTDFTCKGLRNSTADDGANAFFDSVLRKLSLQRVYRQATWLYYTVGLVPILMNEPGNALSFVQILDPRYVRVQEWYGKTYMYLMPDKRMIAALIDPKGTTSPFNRDYYQAMPNDWKKQLQDQIKQRGGNVGEGMMIKLTEGSYSVIQNRDTPIDRTPDNFDGSPLQPYFGACEQYRMLMAGDFAAGFLAKNLLALVSVGDPKAEGDNYIRPDGSVLANLQQSLQNPNQAQWIYGDPTFNVRYITPDADTFASEKYDESRSQLKQLLPSCFWYGDDGSFANSQTSMKALQEEVDSCNGVFDERFWRPIYERAAQTNPRVAKKAALPPLHDHNALKDDFQWLQAQSALYANGGLDIRTLVEAHGYDFEAILTRLKDQKADVKKGFFIPAFESNQGIVTGILEKSGVIESTANEPVVPKTPLGKLGGASSVAPAVKPKRARIKKKSGEPGRPSKAGSRPQPETNSTRAPRPGGK